MNPQDARLFFGIGVLIFGLACLSDYATQHPEQWKKFVEELDKLLAPHKLLQMSLDKMNVEQLEQMLSDLEKKKEYQLCIQVNKVLEVKKKLTA